MKRPTVWLSVGGGIAGVIILVLVAVSLIAARPAPPTTVTLVRTRAAVGVPTTSFLPHSVNDAAETQQLYNAVRALPPVTPNAVVFCPLDLGARYQLTFSSASGVQLTATLDGGGCHGVQIGNQRYTSDAAFWQLLTKTFGVAETQLFPVPPK